MCWEEEDATTATFDCQDVWPSSGDTRLPERTESDYEYDDYECDDHKYDDWTYQEDVADISDTTRDEPTTRGSLTEQVDEVVSEYSESTIINIYIAGEEAPYKIRESDFQRHKDLEFFTTALKYSHLGGGPKRTLRFPEDDARAFKLLLFWITKGHLPHSSDEVSASDDDLMVLIKASLLGGKYGIACFQDITHKNMTSRLNARLTPPTTELVEVIFKNTTPGAALRVSMVSNLIHSLRTYMIGSYDYDYGTFDLFHAIPGFTAEVKRMFPKKQPRPEFAL